MTDVQLLGVSLLLLVVSSYDQILTCHLLTWFFPDFPLAEGLHMLLI